MAEKAGGAAKATRLLYPCLVRCLSFSELF